LVAKRRGVASFGNLDDDRVVAPGGEVVALEQPPQPASLHAHDGVTLRIEGFAAAEDVPRDRERLQSIRSSGKGFADDVAEEGAQASRTPEFRCRQHTLELGIDGRGFGSGRSRGAGCEEILHGENASPLSSRKAYDVDYAPVLVSPST